MRIDKETVDAQLAVIEVMKTEFLRFFNGNIEQSHDELKARHERIKDALGKCGGTMDGYWVIWLFNELEQRAFEELRKLTLLAQTTAPDLLKAKYFNDLPQQLVDNVKSVQKHLENYGLSKKGVDEIKNNKNKREEEFIYRAKYFLANPEPKYQGWVKNYRSSSLAKVIIKEWSMPFRKNGYPTDELWKNKVSFDPPSEKIVAKYIRNGVKRGELPDFVADPRKPKWKKNSPLKQDLVP